jgi:hypothetical protein
VGGGWSLSADLGAVYADDADTGLGSAGDALAISTVSGTTEGPDVKPYVKLSVAFQF